MKKSVCKFFILILSIFMFSACCKVNSPVVGISMGPSHERWTKDIMYLKQNLEILGAEVIVQNARGDEKLQAKQAQDMIDEGKLDVLIITPVNSQSAGIIADYAKAYGVKVIAYDRLIQNCDLDCYLSFDNLRIGEVQAEYLSRIKPEGKYAILGGAPEDNNSAQLHIGQMNVLSPLLLKGDIQLVIDQSIEGWSPEQAYTVINNYLNEGKKLDAIIASSDELSKGAARALEEHGLGKSVLLSGQDAQTDACRRIVQGTQTMTVYKLIESLASSTARVAISLAKGEDIPNTLTTVNNGKTMVPAILLPSIIPVGIENIRMTVIADGFLDEKAVFGGE